MLGPQVKVMATNAEVIKTMVIAMVGVMNRPMLGHMSWMPTSSSGIQFILLKGIHQVYWAIISIGLIRLSQKTESKNCYLQGIA